MRKRLHKTREDKIEEAFQAVLVFLIFLFIMFGLLIWVPVKYSWTGIVWFTKRAFDVG